MNHGNRLDGPSRYQFHLIASENQVFALVLRVIRRLWLPAPAVQRNEDAMAKIAWSITRRLVNSRSPDSYNAHGQCFDDTQVKRCDVTRVGSVIE